MFLPISLHGRSAAGGWGGWVAAWFSMVAAALAAARSANMRASAAASAALLSLFWRGPPGTMSMAGVRLISQKGQLNQLLL